MALNEPDLNQYHFYPVTSVDDLPSGERLFIEINGDPVVIFNIAGSFYAIADVCTHDDGPLGEGELDGFQITCPRHGAKFDVRTGKALTLPAVLNTNTYPIRVVGDTIEIGVIEK